MIGIRFDLLNTYFYETSAENIGIDNVIVEYDYSGKLNYNGEFQQYKLIVDFYKTNSIYDKVKMLLRNKSLGALYI